MPVPKGMSMRKNEIRIYVSPEEKELIRQAARRDDRSVGSYVRRLILAHVHPSVLRHSEVKEG